MARRYGYGTAFLVLALSTAACDPATKPSAGPVAPPADKTTAAAGTPTRSTTDNQPKPDKVDARLEWIADQVAASELLRAVRSSKL